MGLIMKSKISKHFKRSEFECQCGCGQDTIDYELLIILEEIHRYFDIIYGKCYIFISSGNRCKKHNANIKNSSKTSKHIISKACDFKVYYFGLNGSKEYVDTQIVYNYLVEKYPNKYGIIKHKHFIHFDVREIPYHII